MSRFEKVALLLADAVLVGAAIFLALLIRFGGVEIPQRWIDSPRALAYLGLIAAVLLMFQLFGLYHKVWRYASFDVGLSIGVGATVATAPFMLIALVTGGSALSRSIIFLAWIFIVVMVGGLRLILRLRSERSHARDAPVRRLLIVGANDAGEAVQREVGRDRSVAWQVVGFVDEDEKRKGLRIRGAPVLGARSELPDILKRYPVDEIVIAEHRPAVIQDVLARCDLSKTTLRVIPSVSEMMEGRLRFDRFREVRIEDLLERDPVALDGEIVRSSIQGKRVLVTGAGGSIGSEICRQVSAFDPSELVLLGRGENSIYEIGLELRGRKPTSVIADVRDRERMRQVMQKYRPHVVFHAAAHKHVPLMEANVSEAVTVNILGTQLLMELAAEVEAERFILLSTDKAVQPRSVMGATKRTAELLLQQAATTWPATRYAAVRFGNVLDSRGSVIPTFRRQIALGGPVTVTHPDMTRFFMTIPEAVQLVLQAAALAGSPNGTRGSIYILDMGRAVKIIDLARNLIRLSGFEPERDVAIEILGTRPGEKLTEELMSPDEVTEATSVSKILCVRQMGVALPRSLAEALKSLEVAARNDDSAVLRALLSELVQSPVLMEIEAGVAAPP